MIELLPAKGTSAASACRYLTLINIAIVLLSWESDINFTKPKCKLKTREINTFLAVVFSLVMLAAVLEPLQVGDLLQHLREDDEGQNVLSRKQK